MSRNPGSGQSPPKHIVPGLISVERVLSRGSDAVLWVPTVRVFPTGLTVDLELVHTRISDEYRQRLFMQDFTIQIAVDDIEPASFTLGNPPALIEEPIQATFWRRSSSNDGVTAAAWIGCIPDKNLSVKATTKNPHDLQLLVDRDEIESALGRVIELTDPGHNSEDGLTFLD